jgi:hypothetical protein
LRAWGVKPSQSALLGAVLCLFAGALAAQDDVAAREAAVDRYLKAVPMSSMLDEAFVEIAKQLPEGQRTEFVSQMRTMIRIESLERIARQSMLRVFTTDELNALADFYGSPHGASAMRKFGIYMADVMPAVQEEIQRGIERIDAEPPR